MSINETIETLNKVNELPTEVKQLIYKELQKEFNENNKTIKNKVKKKSMPYGKTEEIITEALKKEYFLSSSEIKERTGLPFSTIYNKVSKMLKENKLVKDITTKKYRLPQI